jgi:hypothetical protein
MKNNVTNTSLSKNARIAGLSFLFVLTGYTLSWIFIYARLIEAGNAMTTANNIMINELLFRIGIASDLIIAIIGLVLSWALYILLKPVNKNLALLAFCLKFLDAILAIVTVSLSFISLQLLQGEAHSTVFKPGQMQAITGLFLNLHTASSTIPMVFTSLGFIVFFYLLFKSNYVPRILAGFGIFSYLSILIYAFIKILVANTATDLLGDIELICYSPSILFELIIGLWLLFKGIKVQEKDNCVLKSA